jgi:hypothetical protein
MRKNGGAVRAAILALIKRRDQISKRSSVITLVQA